MSLSAARFVASRAMARRAPVQQQKRGIVDYLTNYPDKVRCSYTWNECMMIVHFVSLFGTQLGAERLSNEFQNWLSLFSQKLKSLVLERGLFETITTKSPKLNVLVDFFFNLGQWTQKNSMQRRNTAWRVQPDMVEAIVWQDGRWIRVCSCWNGSIPPSKWILLLGHRQGKDWIRTATALLLSESTVLYNTTM